MADEICYRPVGHVENEFNEWTPIDLLRKQRMRIVLDPRWTDGLLGVEEGMYIVVIFHFHLIDDVRLQLHPHDDPEQPLRGVFATRTQYRPNPIGLTVAQVLRVEANVLEVHGLDALNGTPVLDIKPFVSDFDTAVDFF